MEPVLSESKLVQCREIARSTYSCICPLVRDATREPSFSIHVCLADQNGNIVDADTFGAFRDELLSREELERCKEKIRRLAAEPAFVSSWQCGASKEKSEEGCVRTESGILVSVSGFPGGGWNEGMATVFTHRAFPKDMPLKRVRVIAELSKNKWVRHLMRACKIPY